MSIKFRAFSIEQKRIIRLYLLAICVALGALFGVVFAVTAGTSYSLMMRMAFESSMSFVGSVVATFVPYLIAFFILTICKPLLIYGICGISVFFFAAESWLIMHYFGSAGWLAAFMLLFSDILLMPLLIWCAIQRLSGCWNSKRTRLLLLYLISVGMIHYSIISPIWADAIYIYNTMGRYAIHVGFNWCL